MWLKQSTEQEPFNLSSMASAPLFSFSLFLPLSEYPAHKSQNSLSFTNTRNSLKFQAVGADNLLGDFGARDPFPEEIESKFGEKVLGNCNTEHKILVPNAAALSLAEQDCIPVSQFQQPMSEDEAKQLLCKVLGWRIVNEEGILKLQGLWKVRDLKCGEELIRRINQAVESTGHYPILHLEEPNQVIALLWTSSIGGLTVNDFIVAAKMDKIKTSDLIPRKRVWA